MTTDRRINIRTSQLKKNCCQKLILFSLFTFVLFFTKKTVTAHLTFGKWNITFGKWIQNVKNKSKIVLTFDKIILYMNLQSNTNWVWDVSQDFMSPPSLFDVSLFYNFWYHHYFSTQWKPQKYQYQLSDQDFYSIHTHGLKWNIFSEWWTDGSEINLKFSVYST